MIKAELHNHLEGTATPALVQTIAERNGIAFDNSIISDDGQRFVWSDFLSFLDVYEQAANVIRQPVDYYDITYHYLKQCAAEGCVYVEMQYSPEHAERASGLPSNAHLIAIGEAIQQAEQDFQIYGRIILTAVRHYGVAACEGVASKAHSDPHSFVVGFGLAGDEAGYPPAQFTRAFDIALDAGLGCTIHAGEMAGPESISAALKIKGVTRLGHGVRAIEDPSLLSEIKARNIHFEVCPSSNVALGVFPDYAHHPLRLLYDIGINLSLNSDDPPYFGCTVGGEYAVASAHFGFDGRSLTHITRNAITASFADEALKTKLLALLDEDQ